MANTQALATTFKRELLTGHHNFGVGVIRAATTTDTFKAALYLTTATMNAATTAYSATNEVSGAGYTAGGVNVTMATVPTISGTTAFVTPSAAITYTDVTLSTAFDAILLYNSTQGNRAVSVHTFASQTITAGTLTLSMPVNAETTALLRLA